MASQHPPREDRVSPVADEHSDESTAPPTARPSAPAEAQRAPKQPQRPLYSDWASI